MSNIKEETRKVYSTQGVNEFINEQGEFEYATSPIKAIRKKCLYDCCAGELSEVKKCNCTTCFLYPFRLGFNPYHSKAVLTDEEKVLLNVK